MPFYEPSKTTKTAIDFECYKPVKVFFCCEADGKITPTKEYPDRISFRCLFTCNFYQQSIMLDFYFKDHVWLTPRN